MQRQRLIVGVSGSSAPQLAWTTLQALRGHPDIETHLVISRGPTRRSNSKWARNEAISRLWPTWL